MIHETCKKKKTDSQPAAQVVYKQTRRIARRVTTLAPAPHEAAHRRRRLRDTEAAVVRDAMLAAKRKNHQK